MKDSKRMKLIRTQLELHKVFQPKHVGLMIQEADGGFKDYRTAIDLKKVISWIEDRDPKTHQQLPGFSGKSVEYSHYYGDSNDSYLRAKNEAMSKMVATVLSQPKPNYNRNVHFTAYKNLGPKEEE